MNWDDYLDYLIDQDQKEEDPEYDDVFDSVGDR